MISRQLDDAVTERLKQERRRRDEQMTDARGRRYVLVTPFHTSDDDIRAALAARPEPCVDCGAPIVHGATRYFQRHNPAARYAREHPHTARTLEILTFDHVCGSCGDWALTLATR